jgi:hypothetical protein
VHDGGVVIWDAEVVRCSLIEIRNRASHNVAKHNDNVIVSVRAALFMIEAHGVADFMDGNPKLEIE